MRCELTRKKWLQTQRTSKTSLSADSVRALCVGNCILCELPSRSEISRLDWIRSRLPPRLEKSITTQKRPIVAIFFEFSGGNRRAAWRTTNTRKRASQRNAQSRQNKPTNEKRCSNNKPRRNCRRALCNLTVRCRSAESPQSLHCTIYRLRNAASA